jgi:serine/threonine protein kinase
MAPLILLFYFHPIIVAMHLDLKPGNMVYFREPNGAMVLKAIDFGSCEILDRNDGPENRANFSKNEVILPVGTPYYSSPELKYDIELVVS